MRSGIAAADALIERLIARAEAAEAERDAAMEEAANWCIMRDRAADRLRAAEARIAAVLAQCDEWEPIYREVTDAVRAALSAPGEPTP